MPRKWRRNREAQAKYVQSSKFNEVQNTVFGLIFYRFLLTEKGTGIFEPSPLIESDVEFQSIFWTSKSEGRGNMFVKVNHTPTHTQTKKDDK